MTLANGHCFKNLRPGVIDLGPHECYEFGWNQHFADNAGYRGVTTFELSATDITAAPYNRAPFPMSGNKDRGRATFTGLTP